MTTVAVHQRPSCGHKLLMECPLTVEDWGSVFDAYCGFLMVCRIVAERAHERDAARESCHDASLTPRQEDTNGRSTAP